MNKLLLSVVAVATLSLATGTLFARAAKEDTRAVEGNHMCGTCSRPMCGAKEKHIHGHHCECAHKVCTQPVQAEKHAPMVKTCDKKDRCPENTVARTNKRGDIECVETRAEEVIHPKICDTECRWSCPPGFEEQEMTPGHTVNKVHDNRHVAKKRRMEETEEKVERKSSRRPSKSKVKMEVEEEEMM